MCPGRTYSHFSVLLLTDNVSFTRGQLALKYFLKTKHLTSIYSFCMKPVNTFHSTSTDPSLVSFGVKTTKGSSLTAANTPAAYVLRRRWQTNKQTYWYHCTTGFAYQIEDCQIFPLPTVKEHFRWPLLCFHVCDGVGNKKVPDKSKAVVRGESRDFHASAKSNWQLLWKQLFS